VQDVRVHIVLLVHRGVRVLRSVRVHGGVRVHDVRVHLVLRVHRGVRVLRGVLVHCDVRVHRVCVYRGVCIALNACQMCVCVFVRVWMCAWRYLCLGCVCGGVHTMHCVWELAFWCVRGRLCAEDAGGKALTLLRGRM
jgi:hypothetical protein